MNDQTVAMALVMVGAALGLGLLAWLPRCPECGSFMYRMDDVLPGLRHCLRCFNVYEAKRRP
ncbi:MAG: hypothetical protein J2P45_06400 [Candidatus Dormibacteraeota bacterium]|nr:hypothetical protein [Candidatus Dormibacteraeota bacterium]